MSWKKARWQESFEIIPAPKKGLAKQQQQQQLSNADTAPTQTAGPVLGALDKNKLRTQGTHSL
jgi:hypothetical protein